MDHFKKTKRYLTLAGPVIGTLVAAVVAAAPAHAAEVLSLSSMAFSSDGTGTSDNFQIAFDGYITGSGCFVTPLHLPRGAVIKKVVVYYLKTQASANISVDLAVIRHRNGKSSYPIADQFAGTTSGRAARTYKASIKIDNAKYAYGLGVCINAGDEFHGAKVVYETAI